MTIEANQALYQIATQCTNNEVLQITEGTINYCPFCGTKLKFPVQVAIIRNN